MIARASNEPQEASPRPWAARLGINRIRLQRWAIRIAIAFAVLWALYLVVANAVGRSDWLQRKLNADPQASQITFDGFWTVIPGNFHLTNLKATFQYQTGTRVHVVGDRLAIDFAVFALVQKHVVAKRLEIDGFVFEETDASMTIPGLPEIASTEVLDVTKAPPALWYDEAKSGWLIRIDDLEIIHARELWFYSFRYDGDGQLHGGVRLRPNRELALDAIRFDLGPGTGKLMGAPAMRDLQGRIEGTMASIDPAQLHDIAVLRSLSVSVAISTNLENLEFMNDVAMNRAVLFGGTGGRIAVDAKMVDGKIAAPGRVALDLESLWINVAGIAATSTIHADVVVADDAAQKPVIFVDGAIADGAIRDSTMRALLTARGTTMFAEIREVDFTHVDAITLAWKVIAPSLRVEDTQRFNAMLAPTGFGFAGGSVAIDARANGTMPEGALNGRFAASSDVITVVAGDDTTYSATLKAGSDFSRVDSDADIRISHAFVRLDNGAVRHGQTANHSWWARADVAAGRIRTQNPAFIGQAHIEIRDLEPIFTSIQVLHGAPTWIARAANLSPWRVDLRGTLGKKIDITALEAVAGDPGKERARVRLTYSNLTKVERMRIAIDLGVLSVGVDKRGDSVSLILSDVDQWYTKPAAAR